MEKRILGQTGIAVSALGLGTVKFGRNQGVKYPQGFALPDDATLTKLLALAKELGINLLDTAPAYGTSEERLGELLKGQRQDWIIACKAGEDFSNGVSSYNFTPAHFETSLMRSLKRLNTDYIDILLIHSDGRDLDILSSAPLIEKMQNLKKRGLVRAIGASTKTPEGGTKALELMDVAMATYTSEYTNEKSVLDYAVTHNKGVILKKALSSGHAQNTREAIAFGLSHPATTSMIIGTINPEHLRENVTAALAACSHEFL